MKSTLSIDSDFVVLNPQQQAFVVMADKQLHQQLDKRFNGFSGHELVSCYEFDSDWPQWERHPEGDELVVLLSGQAEFILQTEDGDTSINLCRQGEYVLVPQAIWHRVCTRGRCKLLFITPGAGTEHRAL